MMLRVPLLLAWCALVPPWNVASGAGPAEWISPQLRHLAAERAQLESTLRSLPPAPTPQLTGRLGYHSGYSSSRDTVEWVEMDLRRESSLDAVVLVAAASDGGGALIPGYGFPARFRVEISTSADHADRVMVADFTREDFPNPGALPVYLSCGGRRARFLRITATRLYPEGERALFALGEVIVLQGKRNLAAGLSRADFSASRTQGAQPVWGLANLVDGHSVLGPPEGAQPSPTLGYRSRITHIQHEPHPAPRWVQIDLGETLPIDEVRLFPAHPPDFAHRPGYGYPPGLKVELSEEPEFRTRIAMNGFYDGSAVSNHEPISPGDNPITFTATDETARYVRVTAPQLFDANGGYIFALAELQVWSDNVNVALGKPVSAFDSTEEGGWSRAALVDGFTSRANIVDWPKWLHGLSRRRETAQRLALLEEKESLILGRLRLIRWWTLGSLLAGTLLFLLGLNLRHRKARRLEMEALRQRISQDLHDEIGSSLGSIAFLSGGALELTDPEAIRSEFLTIRETAQQALDSMRDLVRLAQSGRYGQGDVTAHLREIADRMLRGIPHTLADGAAEAFNRIPLDQRRDLVLMFKESLHNLVRHAKATKAEVILTQNERTLTLTVRDNGVGFDPAALNGSGTGLKNLQRRASKHGGRVQIDSALAGGATVTISLPKHG